MHSPCHNCPHRRLVCHDQCEDYLAFNLERVEALKAAHKANRGKHEADTFLIIGVLKRRKGAHRK